MVSTAQLRVPSAFLLTVRLLRACEWKVSWHRMEDLGIRRTLLGEAESLEQIGKKMSLFLKCTLSVT